MLQCLGDEHHSLKTRVQLKCQANYEWICVTASVYNASAIIWKRVKAHPEGIWHDSNESLDLAKLHQDILELKKAKLDLDAAKAAEGTLEKFKKAVPSRSALTSLLTSTAVAGARVLLDRICLPVVFKLMMNSL